MNELVEKSSVPQVKAAKHNLKFELGTTVFVASENIFALEVMVSTDGGAPYVYGYFVPVLNSTWEASIKLIACNGECVLTLNSYTGDIPKPIDQLIPDIMYEFITRFKQLTLDECGMILRNLKTPVYSSDDVLITLPDLNNWSTDKGFVAMIIYSLKNNVSCIVKKLVTRQGPDALDNWMHDIYTFLTRLETHVLYGQSVDVGDTKYSTTVYYSIERRTAGAKAKFIASMLGVGPIVMSSPMDVGICKYSLPIFSFISKGIDNFALVIPDFKNGSICCRFKAAGWKLETIEVPKLVEYAKRGVEYSSSIENLVSDVISTHIENNVFGALTTTDTIDVEIKAASKLFEYAWETAVLKKSPASLFSYKEKMVDGRTADPDNPSILKDTISSTIQVVTKKITDFNKPFEDITEYDSQADHIIDGEDETEYRGYIGEVFVDPEGRVGFIAMKGSYVSGLENVAVQQYKAYPTGYRFKIKFTEDDMENIISQCPGRYLDEIIVTIVKVNDAGDIIQVIRKDHLANALEEKMLKYYNQRTLGMFPNNDMYFVNINNRWLKSTKEFWLEYGYTKTTMPKRYRELLNEDGSVSPKLTEMLNISMGLDGIDNISINLRDGQPESLYISGNSLSSGVMVPISLDCGVEEIKVLLRAAASLGKNSNKLRDYLKIEKEESAE